VIRKGCPRSRTESTSNHQPHGFDVNVLEGRLPIYLGIPTNGDSDHGLNYRCRCNAVSVERRRFYLFTLWLASCTFISCEICKVRLFRHSLPEVAKHWETHHCLPSLAMQVSKSPQAIVRIPVTVVSRSWLSWVR
jgi:hypothetical protein